MLIVAAIIITAILITILIAVYHAKKLTTEIESEEDHNTPHFSRRAGEGLENIKKYGIWF